MLTHNTKVQSKNPVLQLTEHYSNFTKLVRAVAHLQTIARTQPWKSGQSLKTPDALDLTKAKVQIVQATQEHCYPTELRGKDKASSFRQLKPFRNCDGILHWWESHKVYQSH